MNYWVISDTHFGHSKMTEYCNRPPDFEDLMKRNLLTNVMPEDTLIHLGDISLSPDVVGNSMWFKENLGCRTILVRGNHDRKSLTWYREHGWDVTEARFELEVDGRKFVFTHRPLSSFELAAPELNIHGHMHDWFIRNPSWTTDPPGYSRRFQKLVSMEETGYMPINLADIIK